MVSDPFYLGDKEHWIPKEKFDWHVIEFVIMASHGEASPDVRVTCKAASEEKSPCTEKQCMMKDLYSYIGWEVFRAAGEIPLGKVSARVDWTDSEEPYIDLEP